MIRGGGGDAALMERRVEEGSGPSNYFINTSKQAATQSPGHLRSRQRGRRLIVMSRTVPKWPLPSRMPKIIHRFPSPKSKAATPSPGRFRPRQRGCQLIVMSLGGGIKRNSQNRPHGAKMAPVAHPPERLKYFDSPLLKAKPPHHPPAIPAQTPPPYV